jgi:hypothetical protein
MLLARRIHHRPEAPWIVQAKSAVRSHKVEVVVASWRRQVHGKAQTARHAQMQQQQPPLKIDEKVLAAAAHPQHPQPHERLRHTPERPAQGLAQP